VTIKKNTIFTNVALTDDGDVWWEGRGIEAPAHLIDWEGNDWTPGCGRVAAHANARFTAPAAECPSIAPEWEDPAGVPISAILIGGRRSTTVPLVTESLNWQHGVFLGSIMGSETTAAAIGLAAGVRRDPFAMLPFCGYDMGDYLQHWLNIGEKSDASKLPKIFFVNWFRKDENDQFIWPGFGDNVRVLDWVTRRCQGEADAVQTPIGYSPKPEDINIQGLSDVTLDTMKELLKVDGYAWREEAKGIGEYYTQFGDKLPKELKDELAKLEKKLG